MVALRSIGGRGRRGVEVPRNLIIYLRGLRLDYKKNRSLDNVHYRVAKKSGVVYSHHDLCRSFGRNMWKLGVPLETISEIMGHENTKQTRQYLGINISGLTKEMKEYSEAFPMH